MFLVLLVVVFAVAYILMNLVLMKSTFTFSLHFLITGPGQFTSEKLNSSAKKHGSNLRRLKNIYILEEPPLSESNVSHTLWPLMQPLHFSYPEL